MKKIIFLCILANIYFNSAEKRERSAYYVLISKAITRPQIYDENDEIINIFQQIWHPKLLFEFARHGKIKREINSELMHGYNLHLAKVINSTSFLNSNILPSINSSSEGSFRNSSSDFSDSTLISSSISSMTFPSSNSSSAIYSQNFSSTSSMTYTMLSSSSLMALSTTSNSSSPVSNSTLMSSTSIRSTTSNSSSPASSSSSYSTGSSPISSSGLMSSTTVNSTTSNSSSSTSSSSSYSTGYSLVSSSSLMSSTTVNSTTSNSSSSTSSSSSYSTGSFPVSSSSLMSSTTVNSTTSNSSSPASSTRTSSYSTRTSPTSSSSSTGSSPISISSSPASSNSTTQPTLPTTLSPEAACFADLKDIGNALIHPTKYNWTLQMLDSFGKPSSGILQGAFNWYGSYEECFIKVPADQRPNKTLNSLEGIYCLATISNAKNKSQPIFFPYGTDVEIVEALCVPSSCSADTLKALMDRLVNQIIDLNPLLENITVNSVTCPPRSQKLDGRAIGMLFLLSVFLLLMFLGTFYDILIRQHLLPLSFQVYSKLHNETVQNIEILSKPAIIENGYIANDTKVSMSHQTGITGNILLAFSVYTNGAKILNVDQAEGSLNCIHGIRFLSISWVILGHTYVYGATNFSDLRRFGDFMDGFLFQAIENAFVSVDSFFLLSGMLVTYSFLKMYERGKVSWLGYYLHRFWRLTPPYMLILGTYVTLMKYLGNGPLWKSDGVELNYCADSWWYNLLYINNFLSMTTICMGWSWYLANDMQFYVISPVILILLVKKKEWGFGVIGMLMLVTWVTSGIISSVYNLPSSSFLNINHLQDFMDKFYIKPYCRIGPYLIGMILGYILHVTNCQYNFKRKWMPWLCWAVAIAMNLSIVYGLVNVYDNHPLSNTVNALYNSLNRTGWAIGLGWVIFACLTGYAGFVNTILSWKFWIPLSRLSYCAYLIHPIMMYIFYLNQKYLFQFSQYLMVYLFLANLIIAFAAAFVFSLAFESPMMGLEKVLRSRNKPKE